LCRQGVGDAEGETGPEAAKFDNVDLSGAELGRTNFTNAELDGVNFEFANLARAIFIGSRLVNVDFSGSHTFLTHFEDANLTGVTQLSQMQLEIACGNEGTQLPKGLERPVSWPCEQ
jgi:uncharacterized protein YjbI with pentapeptide repeats